MDTPKDATSLLNVLQFIAGMVGTQTGGMPQGSLIASILGSLQASTNGNALDVSLTIPENALEQLIKSGRSSTGTVTVAARNRR